MAKILTVATHATDDPTKCTLAFITAIGALGAGKEVTLALLGLCWRKAVNLEGKKS
jgi:predicted peroxiredoxin